MDTSVIDNFYDACIEQTGNPPMTALFDRRVLVPLDYVAERLSEPAREITADQVRTFAGKGWVTILPDKSDPTRPLVPSLPLYAIDRLKQYIALSAAGVPDAELTAHAEFEEWLIDAFCVDGDLAYIDDDIDQLIDDVEAEIAMLSGDIHRGSVMLFHPQDGAGGSNDANLMEKRLRNAERNRQYLRGLDRGSLSSDQRRRLSRFAHRVRARNEMIRVSLLQAEYERMNAGWSFFVEFTHSVHIVGGTEDRSPDRPSWASTLLRPLVTEEAGRLPIRVPGFVLRDDGVQPTRTLTPDEYRTLWDAADLDQYLEVVRAIWSEKACPHCGQRLSITATDQRVYCSRACSNAARQARYRALHPDAVKRSQNRWRRA